jgi:K+-transporting ATPase KdpF subunit
MHTESLVIIAISAVTMVYLFFALLRPEKF